MQSPIVHYPYSPIDILRLSTRQNDDNLQLYTMYNSFVFRKHSQQLQQDESRKKTMHKWAAQYHNQIRPALIEKYSRRINNFVVRLEEDKKQLYEYRQDTEQKAHELLKEISRKEKFLGDPTIKLRDTRDWTSILSTTERIENEKNKRIFENKFGDSNLAFRSIASQSAYNSAGTHKFRNRTKDKEIHKHNMRFSSKSQTFNENKREKRQKHARTVSSTKVEQPIMPIRRMSSHQTYGGEEESRSHAQSVFSFAGIEHMRAEEGEERESVSNHKEPTGQHTQESEGGRQKVYFKQIVDLQQNSHEPQIKKALHQILVRFGISRIKDVKKQAMVETDKLESDDF